MNIKDKVVAVTGGGSGIGRALCNALAEHNPKGLAVIDINQEAAERVAKPLDALALQADVGSEAQVRSTIEATQERFGPIDLYIANAGIGHLGGVELDDALWQETWNVNVMAHVYACRALIPAMEARGDGYLVFVSSAAGLLANMGTAAYTATKHAAIGLAEWVAMTHGPQGVKVSCVCPQFVRTPMVENFELPKTMRDFVNQDIIEPEAVALETIRGIEDETFLILPHPVVMKFVQAKAHDHEQWMKTMMGLNKTLMG